LWKNNNGEIEILACGRTTMVNESKQQRKFNGKIAVKVEKEAQRGEWKMEQPKMEQQKFNFKIT